MNPAPEEVARIAQAARTLYATTYPGREGTTDEVVSLLERITREVAASRRPNRAARRARR